MAQPTPIWQYLMNRAHAPRLTTYESRRLYQRIVPNQTVFDVQCSGLIIRKFTPDGRVSV